MGRGELARERRAVLAGEKPLHVAREDLAHKELHVVGAQRVDVHDRTSHQVLQEAERGLAERDLLLHRPLSEHGRHLAVRALGELRLHPEVRELRRLVRVQELERLREEGHELVLHGRSRRLPLVDGVLALVAVADDLADLRERAVRGEDRERVAHLEGVASLRRAQGSDVHGLARLDVRL